MSEEAEDDRVRWENPATGVARIVLARADKRNAQDPALLYQLDNALFTAAQDDGVRVIVLAADGPDFSAGHDLDAHWVPPGPPVATMQSGFDPSTVDGHLAFEQEAFLGLCRRWRDLPKPTIAQVQGRCVAAGLMLVWPMDLIIAGRSASFGDPATAFGCNGVEYFAHAWELGSRLAKELLFTGDAISAEEARGIGMVNHVHDDDDLEQQTLALAVRIAARSSFGVRMAKQSVNASIDAQGQTAAMDIAFGLHQAGHANNLARYGDVIDPSGIDTVRTDIRHGLSRRDHR